MKLMTESRSGFAEEALRIGEAHEAEAGVVLVEAGMEDAGDAEALVFGNEADDGVSSPWGLVTMTVSPTWAPM